MPSDHTHSLTQATCFLVESLSCIFAQAQHLASAHYACSQWLLWDYTMEFKRVDV